MTDAALLFIVGLCIGWIGRDVWQMCVDLLDIWREGE